MCGWQVKLCDHLLTRAISERFRSNVIIVIGDQLDWFTYLVACHSCSYLF